MTIVAQALATTPTAPVSCLAVSPLVSNCTGAGIFEDPPRSPGAREADEGPPQSAVNVWGQNLGLSQRGARKTSLGGRRCFRSPENGNKRAQRSAGSLGGDGEPRLHSPFRSRVQRLGRTGTTAGNPPERQAPAAPVRRGCPEPAETGLRPSTGGAGRAGGGGGGRQQDQAAPLLMPQGSGHK